MTVDHQIVIIGTGFGGLCMAHKLKEAGYDDLLILEKAPEVGGTWRENTYPGAECDIPSVLYSYSFAPNPSWDFKWAKQKQIFSYLKDFASDNGLRRHIQFHTRVLSAHYDQSIKQWKVETDKGSLNCKFLISAIGQLHIPSTPKFKGFELYKGTSFHSAEWGHSISLSGKRVAVVGCAASAIQLIPEVAKKAEVLTVYQRTPNWVIDKGDRPYSRFEKWVAARFPAIQKLYRFGIWCLGEYFIYPVIKGAPIRSALARAKNRHDMRKYINDPKLQKTLTPNYPVGAKRVLFSDKFYKTLARDNVELVTDAIQEFYTKGIRSQSKAREHDVVVFATGFHTNPFLKEIDVVGSNGETIKDHWKDGAHAYMGIITHGFPNLLLMYGPNTNTGHTSVVAKLEQQAAYIVQLIERAKDGDISVNKDAEHQFDQEMQRRLVDLAWSKIDASWYKDGDKVTNNWPGSSVEYRKRMKTPIWEHFTVQ